MKKKQNFIATGCIIFSFLFSVLLFATSKQTALIVIDMQDYFVTRNGDEKTPENQKIVKELIAKQIYMINQAKSAGRAIVIVEYVCDLCGYTTSAISGAVQGYKNLKIVKKDTDDLFDEQNSFKKELDEYLKEKNIGELIISGANGGACVIGTIAGALKQNFDVVVSIDTIADFNYPSFIYPYSFEQHNMKKLINNSCPSCKFQEVANSDLLYQGTTLEQMNSAEDKTPSFKRSNSSSSQMRSAQ